jgi:membrane protein YqaA with SNARE-associated domain
MLPHQGWLAGIFYFFVSRGAFGVLLLSALDSSFLMLPFANDIAVIVLVSLHHGRLPLIVGAATLGSLIGCGVMFAIGHAGGENFIRRHMSPQRFEQMQRIMGRKGPILLATPAIIPPPFPFTAFVLGAGALEVRAKPFLMMLTVMRLLRFLAEGIAAIYFGRGIANWLQTPSFRLVIDVLMGLAVLGSAYSVYRLIRTTRGRARGPASDGPQPDQTGTK